MHNGRMEQGEHIIKLDTKDIVAGKYFIRINTDKAQKTKAFVKY
jgi:hypothetical protein